MKPAGNNDQPPLRAEDITAEIIAGWFKEIIRHAGRGVPTTEQCVRLAETVQTFTHPADHVPEPRVKSVETPQAKARRETIEKTTKGLHTALKTALKRLGELERLAWRPAIAPDALTNLRESILTHGGWAANRPLTAPITHRDAAWHNRALCLVLPVMAAMAESGRK